MTKILVKKTWFRSSNAGRRKSWERFTPFRSHFVSLIIWPNFYTLSILSSSLIMEFPWWNVQNNNGTTLNGTYDGMKPKVGQNSIDRRARINEARKTWVSIEIFRIEERKESVHCQMANYGQYSKFLCPLSLSFLSRTQNIFW